MCGYHNVTQAIGISSYILLDVFFYHYWIIRVFDSSKGGGATLSGDIVKRFIFLMVMVMKIGMIMQVGTLMAIHGAKIMVGVCFLP